MGEKPIFPDGKQSGRPYSPGLEANGFLFISGQLALGSDGKLIRGDIQAMTRQCLENVAKVLKTAGCGIQDVVKTTIFLKDMADFDMVNQAYADFFKGTVFPARSCVQVAALPLNADIEIEAIAQIPSL